MKMHPQSTNWGNYKRNGILHYKFRRRPHRTRIPLFERIQPTDQLGKRRNHWGTTSQSHPKTNMGTSLETLEERMTGDKPSKDNLHSAVGSSGRQNERKTPKPPRRIPTISQGVLGKRSSTPSTTPCGGYGDQYQGRKS